MERRPRSSVFYSKVLITSRVHRLAGKIEMFAKIGLKRVNISLLVVTDNWNNIRDQLPHCVLTIRFDETQCCVQTFK